MAGFLFHDIIFGPVKSRRLGVSLGINPLPVKNKFCTFDCIYCECGWTDEHQINNSMLPSRDILRDYLERKLVELLEADILPDSLTFAGNGEPTLHPDFKGIIQDTILLRDKYFPKASVTVLSNSTTLHRADVNQALKMVDQNILKLDAGSEKTYLEINQPRGNTRLKDVVENLIRFEGNIILQTLFVRGKFNGRQIDNTKEEELDLWLKHIAKIKPAYVMIYPIDRATPAEELEKIPMEELEQIARRVNELGVATRVYE